jgi:hypothetical protein
MYLGLPNKGDGNEGDIKHARTELENMYINFETYNIKGRDYCGDFDLDWKIILKWTLDKYTSPRYTDLVAPGIEPRPLDLQPVTLTTTPQRR